MPEEEMSTELGTRARYACIYKLEWEVGKGTLGCLLYNCMQDSRVISKFAIKGLVVTLIFF